jgi:imidazolonepropionase-like amidohydrolase
MKSVISFVALVFVLSQNSQLFSQDQEGIYIKNIRIFDGLGPEIQDGLAIKIINQKIEWMGKQLDADPEGYSVIDGLGYYLMAGMIDSHTHIENLKAAEIALHSGVTTLRSASTSSYQDVTLKKLADEGRIPGPDFIAAGVYITPDLGENVLADHRLSILKDGVNTEQELRHLVQKNAERGVDVIKSRGTERAGLPGTDPRQQSYTKEQLAIIVDEASKQGLKVMVHAHGDEGARAAVEAGAISIEHGTFLSPGTLQLMKERGVYLVPTIITVEDLKNPGGEYSNPVLELRGNFMLAKVEETFKNGHKIGVKMATGADNDYSASSTTRVSLEAAHFVRLGMTNFEALKAATINGAELLEISVQTGTIETGKQADLILLPDNPLEDIMALQDVLMVISNGHLALKRIPFTID